MLDQACSEKCVMFALTIEISLSHKPQYFPNLEIKLRVKCCNRYWCWKYEASSKPFSNQYFLDCISILLDAGAKTLYRSLTSDMELRRFTLHKSAPQNGVLHYILVCDCSNFLTHISCAVKAVPMMRMRLCGDIGLYRPIATLWFHKFLNRQISTRNRYVMRIKKKNLTASFM